MTEQNEIRGAEVVQAPTGLKAGDFWDTANEQLYAYNGTDFIQSYPRCRPGITQMQFKTVRDDGGTNRFNCSRK